MTISSNVPATREEQIADAVAIGKREIRADIAEGRVPEDINSFEDLDDHVDANEYGGLCTKYAFHLADDDDNMEFANEVQGRLHEWLVLGRPFSSDPKDTVREYAPDKVRRLAYNLMEGMGGNGVCWKVRDGDDMFNVDIAVGNENRRIIATREGDVHKDSPQMVAEPMREILVHLNVEVYPFDTRTPDQIADYLLQCIEVGGEGEERSEGLGKIVVPLAEEI